MNKKISIIIICFLLSSIILLVVNNEFDVEAVGGGGSGNGGDNGIGLDVDYMYQVTLDLAGVVHKLVWSTIIVFGEMVFVRVVILEVLVTGGLQITFTMRWNII